MTGRLVGVDMARALAIVGMVAVHFAPRPQTDTSVGAWLLEVPYGKASILFAFVAGIGVSILAQRQPQGVVPRLVWRSVWLLPVGLGVSLLDHPVAVILQYYAVWFLLAAGFVRVKSTTLLAVAVPWLAIGSLLVAWVGVEHADWLSLRGGEPPGGLPVKLLLTGFYPTATWFPVVLAGMWVGRQDLTAPRVLRGLVGGGTVVAAALFLGGHALGDPPRLGEWAVLRSVEGHSEMPLAVIGTTGIAAAIVGACLWLGARTSAVRPLAALGEGALTVYVGQLLVWHLTGDLFTSSSTAEAWVTVAWFVLVSSLGMWAWLAVFRRGPLEAAVRWPFHWIVQPIIDVAAGRPAGGFLAVVGSTGDAAVRHGARLEGDPVDHAVDAADDPSGSPTR